MRLAEKIDERLGHDLADALDRGEVAPGLAIAVLRRERGLFEHLRRAEMPRELLRGRFADMADAERIDEAVECDLATRGDRGEKIARARLAEAFALHQAARRALVALLEREDVLRAGDQAVLVEELDAFRAEPLDVEGVARNEVAQTLDCLRRTNEAAGAAADHVLLAGARVDLAHRMAAASRAKLREFVRHRRLRTHFLDEAEHLRDHVARALHRHRIADADVLTLDLLLVVQRRVRHDDAADRDR